jgi:hypothetical protein
LEDGLVLVFGEVSLMASCQYPSASSTPRQLLTVISACVFRLGSGENGIVRVASFHSVRKS